MFSRNIFQVIKTKGRIRNHGFRSKSSYTKENLTSTILSNIKNLKSKKWAFGLSGLALSAVLLSANNEEIENLQEKQEQQEENPTILEEEEDEEEDILVRNFKYVIVGSGTAAYNAMKEILYNEPGAEILIVTQERMPFYDKPPLAKELWWQNDFNNAGNLMFLEHGNLRHISNESEEFFKEFPNVSILTGMSATDLNASARILSLEDGSVVKYDRCLLALGSKSKPLPVEVKSDSIMSYDNYNDFLKLHHATIDENVKHITVVGGGLLGSELSNALLLRSYQVPFSIEQVIPERGIMAKYLPDYLCDYITNKMEADGIKMHRNASIVSIEENTEGNYPSKLHITLDNSNTIDTDLVVVALGKEPNVDLARKANLEIDPNNGGIVVNSELMARTGLYVAGDIASYYDTTLEFRRREEHHEHAQMTGKLSGHNMVGNNKQYGYITNFWGVLSNYAYEAVGEIDSSLETVGVWLKGDSPDESNPNYEKNNEFERGVVYYMKDKKIVGVLLLNLFDKIKQAKRAVIFPRIFDDIERVTTQVFFGEEDEDEDLD